MDVDKKQLTEEEIKLRYITPALQKAGWSLDDISMEKYFTDGRVVVQGKQHARKQGKKYDYLLSVSKNHPIAIVEAKDNNKPIGGGMQQAMDYAQILDVPFAYSSNGDGFLEHDFLTGAETQIPLDAFPSPDKLKERLYKFKGYTPKQLEVIDEPYYWDPYTNVPRYYQRIAINRTIEAIAKGENRCLLVMATGTGKTFTAFQIIYRLVKSGCKKKVLYLADRNVLIDQTMVQDFKPFKKIMTKIQNKKLDPAYEIYMALYQQLVSYEEDTYMFSCRFLGREFHVDYDLMSHVFGFPKGGLTLPPKYFDMLAFWRKISEDNSFHKRDMMVSGLIRDHAYLLMHKFIAHNIFRKQDSSRVSKDEPFMLWCMHTNTKISIAHFVV